MNHTEVLNIKHAFQYWNENTKQQIDDYAWILKLP